MHHRLLATAARVAVTALAVGAAAACRSSTPLPPNVRPAGPVADPRLAAVTVEHPRQRCGDRAERCALRVALDRVLFAGVPGATTSGALVPDRDAAWAANAPYLKSLLEGDRGDDFLVRSERAGGDAYTVVIDVDRLRASLVQAGVVRRFGY